MKQNESEYKGYGQTNYGFYMLCIVAIVAIVGIVVLINGAGKFGAYPPSQNSYVKESSNTDALAGQAVRSPRNPVQASVTPAPEYGKIKISVSDAQTYKPVQNVHAHVYDDYGRSITKANSITGTFILNNLVPGTYTAYIDAPGYQSTKYAFKIAAGYNAYGDVFLTRNSVNNGTNHSHVGSIKFTVVDNIHNKPMNLVDVVIFDSSGNFVLSTKTTSEGTVSVALKPGYYTASFSANGYYPLEFDFKLTLGQVVYRTITLKKIEAIPQNVMVYDDYEIDGKIYS